jgi:hypothetical protein
MRECLPEDKQGHWPASPGQHWPKHAAVLTASQVAVTLPFRRDHSVPLIMFNSRNNATNRKVAASRSDEVN